jgi:hypothetical protein
MPTDTMSFTERLVQTNQSKALKVLLTSFENYKKAVHDKRGINLTTAADFIHFAKTVRARLFATDVDSLRLEDRDLHTMLVASNFLVESEFDAFLHRYAQVTWGNESELETQEG